MKTIFVTISIFIFFPGFAQDTSRYKTLFIEPNVSVSYDTMLFKPGQRFSNTTYGTEAYEFLYLKDKANKIRIFLQADHPANYPQGSVMDQKLISIVKEMKKNSNLPIVASDSSVRHLNGFSFAGVVGFDKKKKQYASSINGYHRNKDVNSEITYNALRNDLEKDYSILSAFLSGYKTYSKQQIDLEDSILKSRYSVVVTQDTSTNKNQFQFGPPSTFRGFVKVEQALEHTIKSVLIEIPYGHQVFTPDEKDQVEIYTYDKEKGRVEKKGQLVLLNSFGKTVNIPFTFIYNNR